MWADLKMAMDLDMSFYILTVRPSSHTTSTRRASSVPLVTVNGRKVRSFWQKPADEVGQHLYTLCELSSTLVVHSFPASGSEEKEGKKVGRTDDVLANLDEAQSWWSVPF